MFEGLRLRAERLPASPAERGLSSERMAVQQKLSSEPDSRLGRVLQAARFAC